MLFPAEIAPLITAGQKSIVKIYSKPASVSLLITARVVDWFFLTPSVLRREFRRAPTFEVFLQNPFRTLKPKVKKKKAEIFLKILY
jgi:hypothetical protein